MSASGIAETALRVHVLQVGDTEPAVAERLLEGRVYAPPGYRVTHTPLWVITLHDPADTVLHAPPGGVAQSATLLDWLTQLAQAEVSSREGHRAFVSMALLWGDPVAAAAAVEQRLFETNDEHGIARTVATAAPPTSFGHSLLEAVREVEQRAISGSRGLAACLEQLAECLRLGAVLEEPAPAPRTWRDPRASPAVKFAGLAAKLRAAPEAKAAVVRHAREVEQRLLANVQHLRGEVERHRQAASAPVAQLEAMLASTSWRVTSPLRALGRALGRRGRRGDLASRPSAPTPSSSARDRPVGPRRRFAVPPELDASSEGFRRDERLAEIRERLTQRGTEHGKTPRVSLVIPVRGQLDMTLACLCSVVRNLQGTPAEIIIVDDGSLDETSNVVLDLPGIRFLHHTEAPTGFGETCNRGARAARGPFLHFLNNDTVVWPGWLSELTGLFERYSTAGIAGSKLVSVEGLLREAGGVVWRDGAAGQVGRDLDPELVDFNYVRDVDYVSAASMVVPRALFLGMGGFDPHFAPVYYEDTDLAFRAHRAGFRVLYQPLSVVTHHEGATTSADPGGNIQAYLSAHQVRFRQRWSERLDRHSPFGADVEKESDRVADRHALLVDVDTPTPDRDSGSTDAVGLLRALLRLGFRCSFFGTSEMSPAPGYSEELMRAGVQVLTRPWTPSLTDHLLVHGSRYELVVLNKVHTAAQNLDAALALCPCAKVVFNTVDLQHLRVARRAELESSEEQKRIAEELRQEELDLCRRSHCTIVLSAIEKDLLKQEAPEANVRLLPFIREAPGRATNFDDRYGIVFLGGFRHPPNVDGLLYFLAEIWPLLRRSRPGLQLTVVGSNPTTEVLAICEPDVVVLGWVPDLTPVLAAARLTIAPLRYGAGIKGKIATSLGHGAPVVATSVAIEGMGIDEGVGVLVADDVADFAAAVARVHDDRELWGRLSDAGPRFVSTHFGFDTGCRRLGVLLHDLGLPVLLPAGERLELAEKFESLDSWRTWQTEHRPLFDAGFLLRVASTIANRGLRDPWSGREVAPREIRLGSENFRDSLAADGFFSRTRAVVLEWLALAQREASFSDQDLRIYSPEAVTSFAAALRERHANFVGSELAPGEVELRRVAPHRHQDLSKLSFPDASFDLAIANDVLEHVPDLDRALVELHRTLAPGGALIATVPFLCDSAEGRKQALLRGGTLVHLSPPEYHGNPLSERGSLVFEIPGWDLVERARAVGFVDVAMHFRASLEHGVIGTEIPGVFVLSGRRAADTRPRSAACNVIGVAGLPRSGTTLVAAILDAHSRCKTLYEPWNGDREKLGYEHLNRAALQRRVGLELPAETTLVVKETSTQLEYLDCLEHLLASASSPRDVMFCWIVREPWHVYLSTIEARRTWWGAEGLEVDCQSLEAWAATAVDGLRRLAAMARRVPTVVVSYERLVERPVDVVPALMAACGHRFEVGQLHYQERVDRLNVRGDVGLWQAPAPISPAQSHRRSDELAAVRERLSGDSRDLLDRLSQAMLQAQDQDVLALDEAARRRFLVGLDALTGESRDRCRR